MRDTCQHSFRYFRRSAFALGKSSNIVGIVRFSVVSTLDQAFVSTDGRSLDDKVAVILNDDRMERRFQFFETITLPSLDAQSDKDFFILIAASTLLGPRWKQRLLSLAATRPYLVPKFYAPENFRSADTAADLTKLLTRGAPFYTFRLDDDDALSLDFIERAKRYVAEPLAGHALSFCRGFYLEVREGAGGYVVTSVVRPNIAAGFGAISSFRSPRTIFEISDHHHRAHKWMPVITDARKPAFLALTHPDNDTTGTHRARIASGPEVSVLSAEDAATLLRSEGFAVEIEALHLMAVHGLPAQPMRPDDLLSARPDTTHLLSGALANYGDHPTKK
jgi:hypothetical protein